MTNEEAINELLQCYSLYSPFKTAKKTNEAISMAIKALEKAPTALDHIHNVVAENAYDKGYDAGHKEGYERGKADTAISAQTLAKRLTAKFDDVLSVADVLEELEALEAVAKGE